MASSCPRRGFSSSTLTGTLRRRRSLASVGRPKAHLIPLLQRDGMLGCRVPFMLTRGLAFDWDVPSGIRIRRAAVTANDEAESRRRDARQRRFEYRALRLIARR